MKKILEFHGNGSVVEVEAPSGGSPKHQASSAKQGKLQAPSHKLQARGACDKLSQDIMSH